MSNSASHFPLWDVIDDNIVTTSGGLFRVVELRGLDPDCTADATWQAAYDGMRDGLRGLPDDIMLQFFLERCPATATDGEESSALSTDLSMVLAYQRRQRARFLKERNLRRHRTFLAYGYRWGLSKGEFRHVSPSAYSRQREKLDEIEERLTSMLVRGRLRLRRLVNEELLHLIARQVRPDRQEPITLHPGHIHPPLSPREQIVAGDVVWTDDDVQVGPQYFKVLAAKSLPAATHPRFWNDFDSKLEQGSDEQRLLWDHRIVLYMTLPKRRLLNWLYQFGTRIANTVTEGQPERVQDAKAKADKKDMEALGDDMVAGECLVNMGLQVVIWSRSRAVLRRRSRHIQNAFLASGVTLHEESMAHHLELFKSVAGMGTHFDRWRLVTSRVAADLIPNETYSLGDPHPTLVLERPVTRTPFGVGVRDLRSNEGTKARTNDNFLIFGESGAGKSVFVNMLLAYGMLSSATRGRVVGVDYAGPEKSSLLVAANIFGGQYVGISGDGAKINPLPAPMDRSARGSRISDEDFGKLVEITNILLLNTAASKDNALHTGIVQASIRRLYERWEGKRAPTFSNLYEALRDLDCSDDDNERRKTLLGVMDAFLKSNAGAILNHDSTISAEQDFVVYDLFGLSGSGFEAHHRKAIALAVTQFVRSVAFDRRPDRYKYVLFDEAGQLFDVGMESTMLEMLRTARAHGCAVGLINQLYTEFRPLPISGVARTNTSRKTLLSQGDDAQARDIIAEDFGLNERERGVLASIHTIPGRYADLLIRSTVQVSEDPGAEPERITARARLHLSPLDEQVVSTSPEDRAAQMALQRAYAETPRFEILAYLADKKRRAQAASAKRRATG